MKKLFAALSCTAIIFGLSARPASADQFSFTIPGTTDAGSGLITASAVSGQPGIFSVSAISGTLGGKAIGGILGAGTYPTDPNPNPTQNFSNDNLLYYPSTAQLGRTIGGAPGQNASVDVRGISFLLGGANYNLYYGSFGFVNGSPYPTAYNLTYGTSLEFNDVLAGFNLTNLSVPAATPEPSSLILFGTGALGLVGVARRRFLSL